MARHGPRRRRAGGVESTIRIIGGEWRGRRLPVTVAEGLRPTPDRVRETLFNWLAPRIEGARCVDLFAGTGALGLEALSRGAGHVQFIDADAGAIRALRRTLETLAAVERATLTQADALRTPITAPAPDIVFMDPPFSSALHGDALDAVLRAVTAQTRIYIEYPEEQFDEIEALLAGRARILKQKRAGQVGYCLAQPAVDGEDGPL